MKDVLCGGCGHPKNTHFKTGACAYGYQDWIKMAKESQLNGKEVDDDWCDCKDFVKKETVPRFIDDSHIIGVHIG